MPSHLDAALDLSDDGLSVFPLNGIGDDGFCECGNQTCHSPGKHPRLPGGFKIATRDKDQIRWWWTDWPNANIGVATGPASGCFVLDIDAKNGGIESLAQIEAVHGQLPRTLEVLTGSGGGSRHLYFRYPIGLQIGNSAGRIAPGIDVRGDGGYVVAPPSRHISGNRYVFNNTAKETPNAIYC